MRVLQALAGSPLLRDRLLQFYATLSGERQWKGQPNWLHLWDLGGSFSLRSGATAASMTGTAVTGPHSSCCQGQGQACCVAQLRAA